MRDLLQLLERSKQQEQFWTQASASSEKANWNSCMGHQDGIRADLRTETVYGYDESTG